VLYRDTGRLAEAEPLYRRVIAIFNETLPPNHPNQAAAREHYAALLDTLGRGDEAAEFRAMAEAIRKAGLR
jgi:hypothetical protein